MYIQEIFMKNLNKENYKKLYLILSVLIVVVILSMLIYIVRKRDKQITEDTQYTMSRETVKIKESLESSMGYAFNSIKVTASEISKRITGDEIEAPTQLIRELLPNTPFTSIEYIRADGTNSAARRISSSSDALFHSVLVGMQPSFRQVPPTGPSLTRVTSIPFLAASTAVS